MLPFFIAAVSASTGLIVETPAIDALCPDLEQTRLAVSARIGQLDISPGRPWRASYTLVHAPSSGKPDVIRLGLVDPDANVRLRRDLPLQGQSCRDMAEVIALVLDRYFRSLRQGIEPEPSPDQPESGPSADGTPTSGASQSPTAPSAAPASAAVAPQARSTGAAPGSHDVRPTERILWLGTAAGWSTPERGLAFEFAAQAELAWYLQLGLNVLAATSSDDEMVGHGEAHLQTRTARVWLALNNPSEGWTSWAGPEIGLAADHAWTTGLEDNGSAWRPRFLFGLAAGAAVWLLPSWAVTLRAGVDLSPRSLTAELAVGDDVVLRESAIEAYATLGVAYGIGR
jgi:hypothetical protein